jgi:hypothetical protein
VDNVTKGILGSIAATPAILCIVLDCQFAIRRPESNADATGASPDFLEMVESMKMIVRSNAHKGNVLALWNAKRQMDRNPNALVASLDSGEWNVTKLAPRRIVIMTALSLATKQQATVFDATLASESSGELTLIRQLKPTIVPSHAPQTHAQQSTLASKTQV